MGRLATLLALISLLVAGCATQPTLRPAPNANLVADRPMGARASAQDVEVVARAGAWRWRPGQLDEFVTPMLVEIENNSDRTLRIRLSDFQLMGPNGVELAALPTYDITGEVRETVGSYVYSSSGFFIAPHYHPYYPRFSVWRGRFLYHPYYFETYYPIYRTYRVSLPTNDMIVRALPEGTLRPGGTITGFIYFQHLDRQTARRAAGLRLVFELVDAESMREFGLIEIPFVVDR